MFKLYAKDLSRGRVRDVETTDRVLAAWLQRVAPYEYEKLAADLNDRAAMAYFRITAERVFFRTQIYADCEVPKEFTDDQRVIHTSPFGVGSVSLGLLLKDNVRAAMAYVPLAPIEGGGNRKAVLARLYCVTGLKKKYESPFVEEGPAGAWKYNWFLSGADTTEKVVGRSWYLAASVLMRCIENGSSAALRQKLSRDFIFTGDVDEAGNLDRVVVDAKLTLAEVPEFEKLKWIVPLQVKDEVSKVRAFPVRNVEEAYVQAMDGMDRATRELFGLVNGGTQAKNLPNIYALLQDGADANLPNEGGWCVRQIIMSNITRKIVDLIRAPGLKDRPTIDIKNEIRKQLAPEWDAEKASSYYGNDPLLFFLVAKQKNARMMRLLKATMNINGVDRDGETALDFAIEAGDHSVEQFLREYGADKLGKYDIHSKRVRAYLRDPVGETERDRMFLSSALANGLNPFQLATFGVESDGKRVKAVRHLWDNLAELESAAPDPWNSEPWVDVEYDQTTVFLEAILKYNWAVAQMCLEYAPREMPPVSIKILDTGKFLNSYLDIAKRFSSPVIVRALTDHAAKCGCAEIKK